MVSNSFKNVDALVPALELLEALEAVLSHMLLLLRVEDDMLASPAADWVEDVAVAGSMALLCSLMAKAAEGKWI